MAMTMALLLMLCSYLFVIWRLGGLRLADPAPDHYPGHPDVPADARLDRSVMGHRFLSWQVDGVWHRRLI